MMTADIFSDSLSSSLVVPFAYAFRYLTFSKAHDYPCIGSFQDFLVLVVSVAVLFSLPRFSYVLSSLLAVHWCLALILQFSCLLVQWLVSVDRTVPFQSSSAVVRAFLEKYPTWAEFFLNKALHTCEDRLLYSKVLESLTSLPLQSLTHFCSKSLH